MMDSNDIKVLVAEDDFMVSEGICRILKNKGFEVIADVSTGKEAVQACCELKPDVVIMDINMPELDGIEASIQINEKCPVPIVIHTAYDDPSFLKKASDAGVSSFLVKPPSPGEVEKAIIIAIARHKDLMKIKKINNELKKALDEIKTLRGIIPICAHCKKIRDEKDYWQSVEAYISQHSEAVFSHGICPDCLKRELDAI